MSQAEVSTEEIALRTTSESSNETTITQSAAGTKSSMLTDNHTTSHRQPISTTHGVKTTENAKRTDTVEPFTQLSDETSETSANGESTAFYSSQSSTVASQTIPTTARTSTAFPPQSSSPDTALIESTMQQTTDSTARSSTRNASSSSEGMLDYTEQETSVSHRHSPSDIVTFTSTESVGSTVVSSVLSNTFSTENPANNSEDIDLLPYTRFPSSSLATSGRVESTEKETSSSSFNLTTHDRESSTTVQPPYLSNNSLTTANSSTAAFYDISLSNAISTAGKVIYTSSTTDQTSSTAVYTSTSSTATSTRGKFGHVRLVIGKQSLSV